MTEGTGYIYNSFKESIMGDVFKAQIIPGNVVIDLNQLTIAGVRGARSTEECRHCGNLSNLRDKRGMCVSCGGPIS